MQLVSFSVKKYRSITAAYKLPIRQSTILIGPNNEGKSNVLRALAISLEILRTIGGSRVTGGRLRSYSYEGQTRYSWADDFPVSLQEKHQNGESVFDLEFRLDASEIADFSAEVKSNLNGTLPIQLSLGAGAPGFKVVKKGPGGPALSSKAGAIAKFVSKRINVNYIPAVRTSEAAENIVSRMVSRALSEVEADPAYVEALAAVSRLQQPVLDRISESIRVTLGEFLPKVKDVRVSIPPEARYRAMRECEIIVDDGTPTPLARKGDGVQSLAALSLMRHVSASSFSGGALILAIEEPESHLHPSAIHQLKDVLIDIARSNQVIMTTHCPLFVDRTSIKSNIIVHNRKAVPAKNVSELRSVLGVRASDNLQHAELVLIVEGEEDRRSLRPILAANSKVLSAALTNGSLGIESLQGGSNLSYKLSHVREALCIAHSYLDNDKCGTDAVAKAQRDGLLELVDVTLTVCQGAKESEFEDVIDDALYAPMLLAKYGVSTQSPKFKGNVKWSDRLREAFKHQGKPWSDTIEMRVKSDVAELVEASPIHALHPQRRQSVDALVTSLESKLSSIAASKKL